MKWLAAFVCGGAVAVLGVVATAQGELSEQQSDYVGRLKAEIDQAARLFKQEQFEASATQVARCQRILATLARTDDAEMLAALKPAHDRLTKAHTLFAEKGVELPPLMEWPSAGDADAASPSDGSEAAANENGAVVSFTRHIAPILVARCGGCHVGRNMGEFSMATFASLMQGSENGEVLTAGKPDESVLLDLVASGEMPPPRPRPRPVPKAEVELIRSWIAHGAEYDGRREDERLLDLVPADVARAAGGPGGRGGPGGFGGARGSAVGGSRPTRAGP